jgi:hypothetical protein
LILITREKYRNINLWWSHLVGYSLLINEVLDERDGKRGRSYFDSEKFAHRINEPEPPYEKWE